MPLRLHLTVVRSRPLFRLGLRRFCCHDACTSWCFALVRCFTRTANGELTDLLWPQFSGFSRENAAHPRQRTAFVQTRVASCIHSYWRFSPGPQRFQNCCAPEPPLPSGIFLKKMTPFSALKRAPEFWNRSLCSRQTRLLVRASTTRPSVKMRLPLYLRESFIHSIRSPVSTRRGCCFSQVMPFPI